MATMCPPPLRTGFNCHTRHSSDVKSLSHSVLPLASLFYDCLVKFVKLTQSVFDGHYMSSTTQNRLLSSHKAQLRCSVIVGASSHSILPLVSLFFDCLVELVKQTVFYGLHGNSPVEKVKEALDYEDLAHVIIVSAPVQKMGFGDVHNF